MNVTWKLTPLQASRVREVIPWKVNSSATHVNASESRKFIPSSLKDMEKKLYLSPVDAFARHPIPFELMDVTWKLTSLQASRVREVIPWKVDFCDARESRKFISSSLKDMEKKLYLSPVDAFVRHPSSL
ncbi:hypothetical protein CEXT_167881 [Caerostris extrusa]|uniref:Uncharacterized protein n=1 Tax=Caerostris extrusa TaxID=172846 RepID=A0AAV4MY42_CAEEX|nr:hypothetical protein CEXT_167881 [Caerostris extrusa]